MVPIDHAGHMLPVYRDFVEVCSEAMVEPLLGHRSLDPAIDLEPGYNVPYGWITIERR